MGAASSSGLTDAFTDAALGTSGCGKRLAPIPGESQKELIVPQKKVRQRAARLANCRSMIAILLISWGLAASAVIGSLVIAAGVPTPPVDGLENDQSDQ